MFFKIDDQGGADPVTNPENLVTSRLAPKSPSEAIKPTVAPPPPPVIEPEKKSSKASQFSAFLNFLVILGGFSLFLITVFEKGSLSPGPLLTDKVVVIPKNSGVTTIADILYREGIIETPLLFNLYVFIEGKRSKLKAGEFSFKPHVNVASIVETLIEGKSVLHSITIPEGLTSEQIVSRINENDALSGKITSIPQEGSLLPDTYKFERGLARQQLIQNMQRAQKLALDQIWSRRANDLPITSIKDLIILASIVEKETGRADERTRVAAVFLNRLADGMKLQSDPTIVYGLVGGKGSLGRGILKSEISQPTPYNTYVISGLPPGPIANPGRASMEAVANPSRTKDLFFVADGTGGHIFAETYEQHRRNVSRWRQIEKNRQEAGRSSETMSVDRASPELEMSNSGTDQTGANVTINPVLPTVEHSRVFDASEGTEKDPLLDKQYDLNSPQDVPSLEEE